MEPKTARQRYEEERKRASAARTSTRAASPASPQQYTAKHQPDLAEQRELFGFDDIPIDVDDVPLRNLIGAWIKRGIRQSDLQRFKRFTKDHGPSDLKNDLKWAIAADLDEEELQAASGKHSKATPPQATDGTPPQQHTVTKNVDININFGELPKLPSLSRASVAQKIKSLRPTRRTLLGGSLVIFVVAGAGAAYYFWPSSYVTLPDGQRVRTDSPEVREKLPQFSTVTPEGKDIRKLGGWARVSPADSNPVFAYVDTIGDTSISVSQQPLPANLQGNTDEKIAELAKAYAATDEQKVDGQKYYVGTDSAGPQSVILAKDDLLILIKSAQKVSDDEWSDYIAGLK